MVFYEFQSTLVNVVGRCNSESSHIALGQSILRLERRWE
jgi:hypothetical protein